VQGSSPSPALGTESSRTGAWAESLAAAHLCRNGLNLLARNHREKFGEIDIVMADADCVVFVEVRYRADDRWGDGLASITQAKQRRLINAARSYLKKHPSLGRRSCRFDVVSISGTRKSPDLRWIRRAFTAS